MGLDNVASELEDLLTPLGFTQARSSEGGIGGWFVEFRSDEFVVVTGQDRSDEMAYIRVGSRLRRKPRAHMRGPWSLSHLRGFRNGGPDHHVFGSLEEQLGWFKDHLAELLDSAFLNSDDLNAWAIKASRHMFGRSNQRDRGRR